jgi:hypothetical protein
MRPKTFEGDNAEERGNAWLRDIARTAPAKGGYDKTDVSVTFSNGEEVEFRFDVQHTSLPDNDTNIRQHVRSWFLYLARPEELPHIARDPRRLKYAREHTTPGQKAAGAALLALLDADPPETTLIGGVTLSGGSEELHDILRLRGEFAKAYSAAKGWDVEHLSLPQILEIRSQQGWKTPLVATA